MLTPLEHLALDSQRNETIGRNYLVSHLVSGGLEVAVPERDRGVDLIAYLDLDDGFVACRVIGAPPRASERVRVYDRTRCGSEAGFSGR